MKIHLIRKLSKMYEYFDTIPTGHIVNIHNIPNKNEDNQKTTGRNTKRQKLLKEAQLFNQRTQSKSKTRCSLNKL